MPFTPFHFGPGAVIKAITPMRFSLVVFCGTQIFMDLEPGYYLLRGEYPVHRFFHTFVGAIVMGALCGLIGVGFLRIAVRLGANLRMSWQCALLSGLVGSISHVLLDSIMHRDIRPFAPLSDVNPFLGLISVPALHWFCLISGLVGIVVWGLLCLRKKLV